MSNNINLKFQFSDIIGLFVPAALSLSGGRQTSISSHSLFKDHRWDGPGLFADFFVGKLGVLHYHALEYFCKEN